MASRPSSRVCRTPSTSDDCAVSDSSTPHSARSLRQDQQRGGVSRGHQSLKPRRSTWSVIRHASEASFSSDDGHAKPAEAPRCFLISRLSSGRFRFLFQLLLLLVLTGMKCSEGMMINRENRHPAFDFTLTPSDKCRYSPNPHYVTGASLFLIECAPDVDEVHVVFSKKQGALPVYSEYQTQLDEIVEWPELNVVKSQNVYQCQAGSPCAKIRMEFSINDDKAPTLLPNGIAFTRFSRIVSPLSQDTRSMEVDLYAGEPTTMIAVASPGKFVGFDSSALSHGFVEASGIQRLTLKGAEGETRSLQLYVSNKDRSILATYTVVMHFVKSTDPNLGSVTVSPGRLDPLFAPHHYTYYYRVPQGTSNVYFSANAVNERDTLCILDPDGLSIVKKNTKNLVDSGYAKLRQWHVWPAAKSDGAKGVQSADDETLVSTIAIHPGDVVPIRLNGNQVAGRIVVRCTAADDTYTSEYVFQLVEQRGGPTQLKSLSVVDGSFYGQVFDPAFSGPYITHLEKSTDAFPHRWIQLYAEPYNSHAIVHVNGKLVNSSTHLSPFFRMPLGSEKKNFRVAVRTPRNPVEEEYFVVADRMAKAYLYTAFAKKLGNWVALISSTVASSTGAGFLSNAAIIQYLSLTNRITELPETYDAYSESFNAWTLEGEYKSVHVQDQYSNRSFFTQYPSPPLSALNVEASGASAGKKPESAPRLRSRTVLQTPLPQTSPGNGVEAHPANSSSGGTVSIAALRNLVNLDSVRADVDDTHRESPYLIYQLLDKRLKREKTILACCSSILVTTFIISVLGLGYGLAWIMYLRDAQEGWTTLRRDFPSVLKPTRFWTFVLDYAFVPQFHSACGILFLAAADRAMPLTIFGISTTPASLVILAGFVLLVFPLAYLTVGLVALIRSKDSVVYSKLFGRYHDRHTDEVDAYYSPCGSLPILANLLRFEIGRVTSIFRVLKDTGNAKGAERSPPLLDFAEEPAELDVPWMEPYSQAAESWLAKPQDGALPGQAHKDPKYQRLLENEDLRHSFRVKRLPREVQNALQVEMPAYPPNRHNLTEPELKRRFPQAVVGYTKFVIQNVYDYPIVVWATVELQHLCALVNLTSYAVWVPFSNLHFPTVGAWDLIVARAAKGNYFAWVVDRLILASLCLLLTTLGDQGGPRFFCAFALLACVAFAVYVPSALSAAEVKWSRAAEVVASQKERNASLERHGGKHDITQPKWPFKRQSAEFKFLRLREEKQAREFWGFAKFVKQIKKYAAAVYENSFWETRIWFTAKEFVLGAPCTEVLKLVLMMLLLASTSDSMVGFSNEGAFIGCVIVTILMFCLINVGAALDWYSQLCEVVRETGFIMHRWLILTLEGLTPLRLIPRKFGHLMYSLQRVFQGKRGVAFGYPGFNGGTTRYLVVDEAIIVNNELGVFMSGLTSPSKTASRETQYASGLQLGRLHFLKMLRVNDPVGFYRASFYRAMPIQVPIKQFFAKGKGTTEANMNNRLAATIQVVNYNESRGATGYLHSEEDDSFLSLYADASLLGRYVDKERSYRGHGYVVRWLPSTKMVMVKGPGIKADHEYSLVTAPRRAPRNPSLEMTGDPNDDDDEDEKSIDSSALLATEGGFREVDAQCKSSGLLVALLHHDDVPDLDRHIHISHASGDDFQVDPTEILVDFYSYNVGTTERRELIIRHRKLANGPTPYTVRFAQKTKGPEIRANVRSISDGVIYLPWQDERGPNLTGYLTLRDETEGAPTQGAVIEINLRRTDRHQVFLPPLRCHGPERIVANLCRKVLYFTASLVDHDITAELEEEPVPCTVVQCVNPVEKEYRVEPNFQDAMKVTRAKMEQFTGLKQDVDFVDRLGVLWSEFMSPQDFIAFWESIGISVVVRGTWINPLTNNHHVYIREFQQKVTEGRARFKTEILRRIDARLMALSKLHDKYKLWHKAYTDNDLYACQLSRDHMEWQSSHGADLEVRLKQLQLIKDQYKQALPDFIYPMNVDNKAICRKEKLDAQLRVWREELTAWLMQREGGSLSPEQGGQTCLQATVEDAMRSVEHSLRRTEHASSGLYRPVLHYVTSACTVRGKDANWKPDPIAAHYCVVRLFPGDQSDVEKVEWTQEKWVPCFIKLAADRIILLFPHELDACAPKPTVDENDIMKRWSWNQLQGFYIPLECLETLMLTYDPLIANDPDVAEDVKKMHLKLVLKKNTEYYVSDRYIKRITDGEFLDEILFGKEGQILKIQLGHTIPNTQHSYFNREDKFFHGDRCTVLPLTFRFDVSYFEKWQSAIRMAQLFAPRRDLVQFYGKVPGEETVSSSSSVSTEIKEPSIPSERTVSETDTVTAETESVVSLQSSTVEIPVSAYKGEFRDCRFSGKEGKLYDNRGKLVYDGEWVEGQRWGRGRCIFNDAQGYEWEFDGEFIGDEMRRGKLRLIDEEEVRRLRAGGSRYDRDTIVAFEGVFALPESLRGRVPGKTRRCDFARMKSNCGHRGPVKISQPFLQSLFVSARPVDEDPHQRKEIVFDVRRAISACADTDVADAAFSWIQDNHGAMRVKKLDRAESGASAGTVDSILTLDAQNALDEYLPYRSKWARMVDPNAGYPSIKERFLRGELVYADGCRYRGETRNGQREGRGIFYCPRCQLMINGYWSRGRPDGFCVMTVGKEGAPERLEYTGHLRAGLREGDGVQRARNGQVVLRGDFNDDLLGGTICSIDVHPEVAGMLQSTIKGYTGCMRNGVPEGKGKLEWTDGCVYEGDFADGKRHGQGIMKDPNGRTILAGLWSQDFPDGRVASLVLPNGYTYTGDVRRGQRQGMGELYHHGQIVYEGLWMNDLPSGRGTLYAQDGEYEGDFAYGKRHGKGRFVFVDNPAPNGKQRVYEGDWRNDRPSGVGRYYDENGIDMTYKFNNGELLRSPGRSSRLGMCNKATPSEITFSVLSEPITAHDPQYWGIKKSTDKEHLGRLVDFGAGVWRHHEDHPFEYLSPEESQPIEEMEPPRPLKEVKDRGMDDETTDPETVEFNIIEATGLVAPSESSSLSPYCKVRVSRRMKRTKPISTGTTNPKWNSKLVFLRSGAHWAQVEVWSRETLFRDDFIGAAEVDLRPYIGSATPQTHELELPIRREERRRAVSAGVVKMVLTVAIDRFYVDDVPSSPSSTTHASRIEASPRAYSVHIRAVAGLHQADPSIPMSPFVKLQLGERAVQSGVKVNGGPTCEINFDASIPHHHSGSVARLEVWDARDESQGPVLIGDGEVDLQRFREGTVSIWRQDSATGSRVVAGEVTLRVAAAR